MSRINTITGLDQLTFDLLLLALRGQTITPLPNALPLATLYDYAHDNQFGTQGQYWTGRKPVNGKVTDILPQLVSDDQVGPALDALVAGQLDKDPEWDAVAAGQPLEPNEAGDFPSPIPELTEWHAAAQLFSHLRDAARAYQWSGRMVGRCYIPDVYRADIESGKTWTLEEALSLVHIQAVDPRQGGPLIDGHGRVLGYYYAYSVVNPQTLMTQQIVELHTPQQVWTLDATGGTPQPSGLPAVNPYASSERQSRRAEYLMWHADRDGGSAITPSIRSKQDRLNAAATNAGRNDEMAGFRQIIVANAEQPLDKDGNAVPWTTGPAVAIRLVGMPYDDVAPGQRPDEAIPRRHTPTWAVIDPVDPAKFQGSIDMWTRLITRALDLEWKNKPEAAISGESKRVSRKGFDKRVAFAAADTGGFLAWAIRSALVLASTLMGEAALKAALETYFKPRLYLDVDSTNLSEYRELLTAWRDGALDLQSLLEATPGVTKPEAVAKRIKDEWAERGGAPGLGATPTPTTGVPAKPKGD